MIRAAAILLVALGAILFGVATGLVYIDYRNLQVRAIKLYEAGASKTPLKLPEPDPAESEAVPDIIIAAMVVGPLGAGLGLAGLLMLVADLPWLRRQSPAVISKPQ